MKTETKVTKIDLKKVLRDAYTARREVKLIEVPPITYLCFEGKGSPEDSEDFQACAPALYGLAFTLKFMCKEKGLDFTVMPLEGQWWTDNLAEFSESDKDRWRWKMMIAVPDFVDAVMFDTARSQLRAKKNPAGLDRATREVLTDGPAAQFLYVGPYDKEGPSIAAMHREVREKGYRLCGHHREIYLSNPQRVSPQALKTIIRQPVEKTQ